MKRSPTRWRPPPRSLALAGAALLAGCVTQGTHDRVVDERDRLAERNALLETSNESLASERVELISQIEDLRLAKGDLERDVAALSRAHDELEKGLAERSDALAVREAELRALRATYDGLVADLQAEVESGRSQIARLREGMGFALPNEVLFAAGSAELTAEGRAVVRKIAERLRGGSERIEVHGHTDGVPVAGPLAARFATNWELAGTRAARVARLLVEAGVEPARVVAVSHAEFAPLAPNDTPEGRAQNRRIEIKLVPIAAPGPEPASPASEAPAAAPAPPEAR